MKECSVCGVELTTENTRQKKTRGKMILYSICKECEKAKRLDEARRNREVKQEPAKEVIPEIIKEVSLETIKEEKKEPIKELTQERRKVGYMINVNTFEQLEKLKLYKYPHVSRQEIVEMAISVLYEKLFEQK